MPGSGHADGEAQQSPAPSLQAAGSHPARPSTPTLAAPESQAPPGTWGSAGELGPRHEKASTVFLPRVIRAQYQLKTALFKNANDPWHADADRGSHPVSVGEGADLLISLSRSVGNLN